MKTLDPSLHPSCSTLVILVASDIFSRFATCHPQLLLLPQLGAAELGLLLDTLDLVAHGIELVLLIVTFVRQSWSGTLSGDPVVP